jgi:hypothetical protein
MNFNAVPAQNGNGDQNRSGFHGSGYGDVPRIIEITSFNGWAGKY